MILKLILTRVALALVTLIAVSAVVFFMAESLGGDIALRVLGRESTALSREIFRKQNHLDDPVYQRYFHWLGGVAHGDLGHSILPGNQPVVTAIALPANNTLWLALFGLVLYLPVTVVVATLGAAFHERLPDRLMMLLTLVGLALPEFVLGTILIYVFAIKLGWFPALAFILPGATFWDHVRALALPAITVAIVTSVYAIRHLRDNLVEVLDSDYVRMASLKGVPRRRVVARHALPNALGPALNVTALNLTYLIGGLVVVEVVFSYDGLGRQLLSSISLSDTPVTEAIALIGAGVYIGANLVADIAGILLNPRLRTA
jgi:peptide/nickel transport system permease protein